MCDSSSSSREMYQELRRRLFWRFVEHVDGRNLIASHFAVVILPSSFEMDLEDVHVGTVLTEPRRAIVPTHTAAAVAHALLRESVCVAKGDMTAGCANPSTPILLKLTSSRLVIRHGI